MFAPGIPEVMSEFKSNNVELASFVVSVYVLGYAFGPLIIAPISELYGRLVVYHTCNIMFVIFTIACAVSSNLNMLIGFRFLEGTFGSAPLTIGGGTIADMIIQEKRGGVMAIWAMGPLMGPVIGPVIGGYLSQAKGWRWVFWLITIVVRIFSLPAFSLLNQRIGWDHHRPGLPRTPRDLPSTASRAKSQETPESNRESGATIEDGLHPHSWRAVQTIHRPTHEAAMPFTHRTRTFHLYGCRLRLSLPPVYHYHPSIRRDVWLLRWECGAHLPWHRVR